MAKSGGWLKSLFGGGSGPDEKPVVPPRGDISGRRSSKRVPAPVGLFYYIPPDRFVTLKLCVYSDPNDLESAIECFLFDVNAEGLGFACAEKLESGSHVYIRGHLAEDLDPLVDAEAEILNCRPFPSDRPRPDTFEDSDLQVYGARIDMQQAMILLKTTLDCVAMHIEMTHKGGEGAVHAGEAPETASSRDAQREAAREEDHSFGALPVAGVEIVEDEVRRKSARDRLEAPLRFIDAEGNLHDVVLTAIVPEKDVEREYVAEVFDFSPEGACVIIDRRIEPGIVIELHGTCGESGDSLFRNPFMIRNRRERKIPLKDGGSHLEYTFGAQVRASMEEVHEVVFCYGLELEGTAENLLFKAALDSVFHAHREATGAGDGKAED